LRKILIGLLLIPTLSYGEGTANWPNLSDVSYVSGRTATEADINAGAAAFILGSRGASLGVPMAIEIPQYAFHVDEESQKRTRVIIIQAEEMQGQQIIGTLDIHTGDHLIGLFGEFVLLGTTKPVE